MNIDETTFQNFKEHGLFYSPDRRPGPENIEVERKKNRELDAASTLCSLSTIHPKVTDEQNETEPYRRGTGETQEIFPTRLSMPNDESELNSVHCFVRKELLEIFFYKKEEINLAQKCTGSIDNVSHEDCNTKKDTPESPLHNLRTYIFNVSTLTDDDLSNDSLRVGFRCVHCAHLHTTSSLICCEGNNAESSVLQTKNLRMNAIYPKSIAGIYRLVCKWQRIHFKKCKLIPLSVRQKYDHLKASDKTRGKTRYWVTSATQLGLFDDSKPRGGIRYDALRR